MNKLLSLLISFCFLPLLGLAQGPVVNRIIEGVPEDLHQETLLLPEFETFTKETAPKGMPASLIAFNNQEAQRCNQTMTQTATRKYPFKVELVSLQEVESFAQKGYRYYLDMTLMPKDLHEVKREVLTPSYRRYRAANNMFTNDYTQLHYYFYIRDLKTNDVYVTTRLRGNYDAFGGISKFLKQVSKDLTE